MQIITGKYRARKLEAVDKQTTRPTLARVKEAIFNIIQNDIEGSVVLDLFAGSGAFGVECVSRGAKKVCFVDHEPKAIETIKRNTRGMTEDFEIVSAGYDVAIDELAKKGEKFDLIYLDPPYKSDFISLSLQKMCSKNLIKNNAIIVVETDNQKNLQNLPNGCIMKKSKKYGTHFVGVYIFVG